jgi:two-component system response regulator AtoC
MNKRKILVIDDEESIAFSVKVLLQDSYDVATTTCPVSGIKFLSENRVDLVILDMKMPKMSGLQALSEIRKIHPDVSVVFLTAFASEENIESARSLGAKGVIPKPFDVRKLRSYVDKIMSGS